MIVPQFSEISFFGFAELLKTLKLKKRCLILKYNIRDGLYVNRYWFSTELGFASRCPDSGQWVRPRNCWVHQEDHGQWIRVRKRKSVWVLVEFSFILCADWKKAWRREGDPMEFWVLSFWPYDKKKVVHFILMHGQDYRYTVTSKLKLLWNLSSDVNCSIHRIYIQLCHHVSLWMI